MRDMISRADLQSLMSRTSTPCVSIYLPTHEAGAEIQQDPIRLKNLLRETEERLTAIGLRSREAQEFLEPVQHLIPERPFWQHQADGLALFRTRELFRHYRLPVRFDELVVVSDRFHIKPLLPLFTAGGRFYILALSQNAMRLLQATPHRVSEVALPASVPASLAEGLKFDDPEKQLQFHARTASGRGGRSAMFYGTGSAGEDNKEDLQRYCRQVDRGLHEILREERVPLVPAAVEYLLAIYRQANTYPHLLGEGVKGNPDELRAEELHARAWPLVEPHFRQTREEAVARYHQLAGTERVSEDVKAILPAASQGRVETLFVATGIQQWGSVAPETHAVHPHDAAEPGDEDLLDRAAVAALLSGGTVYAVEPDRVPGGGRAAAVFRY
jgi:Bacterial archaeo-eukaryotic release factor family 3